MKGTTKTGFEFDVDPQKLDDWEILDQLSEMEDGNMLYAPKFVKKVLGKEAGYTLDVCAQKGHVFHSFLQCCLGSMPHARSLDIDSDEVLLRETSSQSDSVFTTSTT